MSKKNKKRKKIRKDLQFIIDMTCGIFNIIGITLKGIIGYFTYFFSDFNKIWSSILFIFLITWFILEFLYKFYLIPVNNSEKYDLPREETKLTFIEKMFLVLRKVIYLISTVGVLTFAANPVIISDDIDKITIEDDNTNKDFDNKEQENSLTEEQQIIEKYIIRPHDEIIPKDELKLLTKEQLYFIRNGIFAYAGQYFESGYYNCFSWYIGDIAPEDIYIKLNYYQSRNIDNIRSVENGK